MIDYAESVVRINALARKLQKKTSSSFADPQEVYLLVTDIMLESNKIREAISGRGNAFSAVRDWIANLLGIRGVR